MKKPSKRRLRILKRWADLWESKPEEMEQTRKRATLAAKASYRSRIERLRLFMQEWPATLTSGELMLRCQMRAQDFGFLPRSIKTKLKRLGYIFHDPLRGVWVNNFKSAIDKHVPDERNDCH